MVNTLRRRVALLLALVLVASGSLAAQQPRPGYDGAAAFGLELRRLGTVKRVLMVGAHPDDENTQLLSALALDQGADVAYLSLTRGEGGQNGIGPELQEGLGLIRTEELLAARRLDGAHQYFTRAYDYGFSKSAEEAFRHWPREELLTDVVAVMRDFRPDVVISVFSGTERDGHGQHQAAGILARDAFEAAGEASRFEELTAAGLEPFQPQRLMLALWGGGDDAHAELQVGNVDPLLGRSHYQVAVASRGQHRSQDMARAETPGPVAVRLQWVADAVEGASSPASIFAGIDTTLSQIAATREPASAATLRAYEERVQEILEGAGLLEPARSVESLAEALRTLKEARDEVRDPVLSFALDAELADAGAALWRAAGLQLRSAAGAAAGETIEPGGQFPLVLSLWNGGAREVRVELLEPRLPDGWSARAVEPLPPVLPADSILERRFMVEVPAHARPTRPYFLRYPREGDLYRWDGDRHVGVPFEAPLVSAVAEVEVAGVGATADANAHAIHVDPRAGESRRPLRVVPAFSVALDPTALVVPASGGSSVSPVLVGATIRSESGSGLRGSFELSAPAGWRVRPAEVPLEFLPGAEGERVRVSRTVELEVSPPADFSGGRVELTGRFTAADGTVYDEGYTLIDYPHIQPRALYAPARLTVSAIDVVVPDELSVGFVPGAGDHALQALRQLGVQVVELDAEALATANLSGFDAILTGIRAYEVNEALRTHNRRLLDYATAGGTVVVQYNKYEYLDPGIAPFPVEMDRPHGRVTDESAPVRLLQPEHRVLTWPNRITEADFEGWYHERGLYFLSEWGPQLVPLLEMSDAGEEPLRGSLLVAELGQGSYVYSGLAFFRQLPEGVPGAHRLLVNLLSLGRQP